MPHDSKDLDYLTVDSIQWATGYVRPRMTLEDKRAKHRIHQRDFVIRQHERLEQLRRELRCHKLHLLRLQASHEATALAKENNSIRAQLLPDSFTVEPTEPKSLSSEFDWFQTEPESLLVVSDSCTIETELREEDDSAILELLELLPEFDSTNGAWWLPRDEDQDTITPLAWSATTPSEFLDGTVC